LKRLVLTLILIVMSVISMAACGTKKLADHLQAIKQAGVIKVGTSADYPPFEYIDNHGNKDGFDIALMGEIARRLGAKLEWVDLPFDRLFSAVRDGKIDLAISAISFSEDRAEMVSFSEPYYFSQDGTSHGPIGIVVRKDDQALRAKINKIIDELTSEGYINQLALQYLAGTE
jgi:ABC-type amino acid transport substrate-binding protein